jgi:hypothetical protein
MHVGLHRPAGRVSACCMSQVLGSPESDLGDVLVQFQVASSVPPHSQHPSHPPRSVERPASSCRHHPAAICDPLQNGNRESVCRKLGGRHVGHLPRVSQRHRLHHSLGRPCARHTQSVHSCVSQVFNLSWGGARNAPLTAHCQNSATTASNLVGSWAARSTGCLNSLFRAQEHCQSCWTGRGSG